jgi:hypothetical protein
VPLYAGWGAPGFGGRVSLTTPRFAPRRPIAGGRRGRTGARRQSPALCGYSETPFGLVSDRRPRYRMARVSKCAYEFTASFRQ